MSTIMRVGFLIWTSFGLCPNSQDLWERERPDGAAVSPKDFGPPEDQAPEPLCLEQAEPIDAVGKQDHDSTADP